MKARIVHKIDTNCFSAGHQSFKGPTTATAKLEKWGAMAA